MSTLAEKLRQRKALTQTPAPTVEVVEAPAEATSVVVVEPVVVEPVVVEPVVVVVEPVVVEPVVVVVEPVIATIIPPDAPGGEKVPERSEGIMATLAKRRSSKTETPVKAEIVVAPTPEPVVVTLSPAELRENVRQQGALGVDQAKFGDEPVVEKPTAPTSAELTLFVDCFPEKAPFDTLRALEDEIAARTPSLLEHLRKTSPKDVPEGTVDLGEVLFGRGYSTLSASFAIRPISGAWTASTLGPASSKVLEVLLPKATFVVRGRR